MTSCPPFAPRLSVLFEHLPRPVLQFWHFQKVETEVDAAMMFTSSADLLSALEQHGQFSAEELLDVARAWEAVRLDAGMTIRARTVTLVSERIRPPAAATKAALRFARPKSAAWVAPSSSDSGKRLRVAPVDAGILPVVGSAQTLSAGRPVDAEQGEQDRLSIKAEAVWQAFLEVGSEGTLWEDLPDEHMLGLRTLILRPVLRLQSKRVGALLSSLRRWKVWCHEQKIDFTKASVVQLGRFLNHVAEGGPTAAAALHQQLAWWQGTLGFPIQIQAGLLADFRLHTPGHSVVAAPALEPGEFYQLLLLVMGLQGTVYQFGLLLILVCLGCIRWEHIQRSVLVEATPQFLLFRCWRGKRRQQGARPPYEWAAPAVLLLCL
ncbi:unnamed protein product [Polarella glacialis]|uniref:Uncharacterized protein n=1 Tax=Polarella glacialis TaxID=89957 RepID=A0A813H6F1_POLGL|nr:unnamed protein product [Polarella glacialis]